VHDPKAKVLVFDPERWKALGNAQMRFMGDGHFNPKSRA